LFVFLPIFRDNKGDARSDIQNYYQQFFLCFVDAANKPNLHEAEKVERLVKFRRELLLFKAPFAVRLMREQLASAVKSNNIVVVSGDKATGGLGQGKTTQIPQYLADLPLFQGKTVLCSQTSRLTAHHVAVTVGQLYNAIEKGNLLPSHYIAKLGQGERYDILRRDFDGLHDVAQQRFRQDPTAESTVVAAGHGLGEVTPHTRIAFAAEADIFAAVRQSVERGRASRLGQVGEWAPHGTVGCFVLDSSHFMGATAADAERYQQGELGLDVMLYVARTAAAAGIKVVIIAHSSDADAVVVRCSTTPEIGKPAKVVFQTPTHKFNLYHMPVRRGVMTQPTSQRTVSMSTANAVNAWLRAAGVPPPTHNLLVFLPSSEAV